MSYRTLPSGMRNSSVNGIAFNVSRAVRSESPVSSATCRDLTASAPTSNACPRRISIPGLGAYSSSLVHCLHRLEYYFRIEAYTARAQLSGPSLVCLPVLRMNGLYKGIWRVRSVPDRRTRTPDLRSGGRAHIDRMGTPNREGRRRPHTRGLRGNISLTG